MKKINQTKELSIFQKVKQFIFTPTYSVRNVILSVLLGFAIAYIIILSLYGVAGANHILISLFKQNFLDSKSIASLISKISVLGLAGLAIGYGMKAGILNIGVSGQMTAGGLLGFFLIKSFGFLQSHKSLTMFIMLFVVVIGSAFTAMISGVLKVYFKVNEVISTIMINWIVVYIVKLHTTNLTQDVMRPVVGGDTFFVAGNVWLYTIIGVFMFVMTALILWVLLFKSKRGFKTIANGKSPHVASYAGYNSKRLMISTFAVSGAIAGLAGYVMFFLSYNSIPGLESPIAEGFSGIAVALVGMLNPIAIIPSAVLFGLLSGPLNGIIIAGFPPEVILIFSGVVTYFVAISSLFLYLRPVKLIKDKITYMKSQNHTRSRTSKGGR